MKKTRHWLYAAVPLTAAFFSLYFLLTAAWIPLKAELAQWLIERSWQESLNGGPQEPPWPWADTHAAAALHVPGLDVRLVVLQGNSGRNLAFGPVFLDGTSAGQDLVISGHRDTHFGFLKSLEPGERIRLERKHSTQWFEVRDIEIVDSRQRQLVIEPGVNRLSLVTCYPFDSPLAGGPMRYVVTAVPAAEAASPRSPSSG
jgi:sortase A